jgi:hypothetical protein
MLFKLFDWVMIKLGHKYALVDVYGQVIWYRYYVFYVEKHIANNWKEKYLPNLFIHHFIGADNKQWVDGDECHTHPWNTVSFVAKGGYVEDVEYGKAIKRTTAPGIAFTSYKNSHRFIEMTPGTISFFFHGIRKSIWAFDLRKCEVICKSCNKHNNGVCVNTPGMEEFQAGKELRPTSKAHKGWRETTWIKCDQDFDSIIKSRQEGLKRQGTPIPLTFHDRSRVDKDIIVQRRANEAVL